MGAYAAKIALLWKHATPIVERSDVAGDKNIAAIKRFASPPRIGDETAVAWLTLKESVQHGHGIYSLELMEIEKLRNKGGTPEGDTTSADLDEQVAQLVAKVIPSESGEDAQFARRNPTPAAERLKSVDRLMSDALQELHDLQGKNTLEARQRRSSLKRELQQYKEDRAALLIELDEIAAQTGTDVDPAASDIPARRPLPEVESKLKKMLEKDTYQNRWWERVGERTRDFFAGFVSELPELPVFGKRKAGLPTSHFALFREGYRLLRGATESVKEDARQELLRILR